MTSKGNKGLVVLVTIIVVFGFAFLFLSPKYGPQVEIPFLSRGSTNDQQKSDSINSEADQVAQEQVQKRSDAINAAISDLSSSQNVNSDEISVKDVSFEEFSDSSLGCSSEGETYEQVVTPGFKVLLSVGSTEYDYRISEDSQIIKVCN